MDGPICDRCGQPMEWDGDENGRGDYVCTKDETYYDSETGTVVSEHPAFLSKQKEESPMDKFKHLTSDDVAALRAAVQLGITELASLVDSLLAVAYSKGRLEVRQEIVEELRKKS